ncbi:hypothetical protein ACJMK2_022430 [Sinanodonta woodiana]|uniref:Disks large-associated protein 1 n=1 Tax=Sinanodonta woodiana TaxID=1069815 RepID=A0ABD3TJU8_SINWO
MAMRGPASVLDHRKVNDCDNVVRDRLTRQRSPARSHKRDSYCSEEEEVIVSSRISQPYRTSFSAVLAPERTKRERSRSMSPCSSLKGSDRSRSKSPGGRRGKPKHVTYDTQVVVRESGTHDSTYTPLSDKDLNESLRNFSADSSSLSPDNSTMSDITSSEYSSQLRELSQQIVEEYCNLPKPNGTSSSSHSEDFQTPNGDMKLGDSAPYDNRLQKSAFSLKHDYEHERAISYRVAIKSHYSDEIQKMADKMAEEIPPSKNDVKVNSPINSEMCPQIDRRSSLQIKRDEDSGRLTPSKRSVSKSISNFFRRLSPKLVRKPKGSLSNASSQSEDISDSLDHPNDHVFTRGKIRRSFMKFIGKSPSKSKRKMITGSTPVLTTKEQEDVSNRPDVKKDVNDMGRQMPPATSKYLKSIEQDSKSEKEVYQKFKEKQSPGRKWESNPAANKSNAVKSQGVTSPEPDSASGGHSEVKHLKAEPPASLDIRMVPKSVRALQASIISTLSADESVGECSLDDHLTGSDPSLLTQSTDSKKVVLSQSSRDAVSPQSLSSLITSTPTTFVSTAEYQLTSPSSGVSSGYNGDVKYTPLPKLADPADFIIDDSPRTPSYLRISSALSGYGQYSKYSAYKGIEKRSPYSSTLSLQSSKSDLTSPFSPDMPIGKVPCYAPVLKSPTYSAQNGSLSDQQLVNGRAVTHKNTFENGHVDSYPTGDNRKDGNYYLRVTEVEEARLLSSCSKCELELVSDSLPEEASGKLRATIGKANLLISQKFRQFKDLCQQHINPEPGAKLTKWEDLQGFWDMMKIQVDDVDMMFTEVDLMRQNGWREIIMKSRRSSTSSSSPKSGSVTASNTSTPSHTPGSRRKGAKIKENSESSPERAKKAIQAAKAREDARKKILAEKRAAMKQAQQQKETEVEIFLPENGKDNSSSFANGQNGTEV